MGGSSQLFGWLRRSGRNALELIGHPLSAPYAAPHEVVHQGEHHRLRRYTTPEGFNAGAPLLLVPPLMVTAEIYDVSPELSGVGFLTRQGVDVWGVDFGAPEHELGGMERTLDDHLLAVDQAVDEVRERTGQDVHVAGYSQGGLFVYQVAAYRRCRGLASVITMGSPVDMRRNLPVRVHEELVERSSRALRDAISRPLEMIDGLPGILTSWGFKLFSARKELHQYWQLLGILDDREALKQHESRRQFLGGGGFVAWPGPALRSFVDEVLVANRLTSGGFVINGRIVTLADIDCPVLCFVGLRDDLAHPEAVRAVHRACPNARIEEVELSAGHFGLVVGSRALSITWPTVTTWIRDGARLTADRELAAGPARPTAPSSLLEEALWTRLGKLSLELAALVDVVRWERPRLQKLAHVQTRLAFGPGYALARTAAESPNDTFFLWRARAFTHRDAHRRVQRLAAALHRSGVRPGDLVGVCMAQSPDALSALCALSQLGAVIAVIDPKQDPPTPSSTEVRSARAKLRLVLTDPASATAASNLGSPLILSLGPASAALPMGVRALVEGHDAPQEPPPQLRPAPEDVALSLAWADTGDLLWQLSNRSWGAAALHTAALCRIHPADTIYCGLPLASPLALLCALPPSLIANTRLALGAPHSPPQLWRELRRYGASLLFLTAALADQLLATPEARDDRQNPLRCIVGERLDAERAATLAERFRAPQVVSVRLAAPSDSHPSPLALTTLVG